MLGCCAPYFIICLLTGGVWTFTKEFVPDDIGEEPESDIRVESLVTDEPPDWTMSAPDFALTTNNNGAVIVRPEIISGPKDTYVVRNKPATLICQALHAERISFKCGADWVRPKHHVTSTGTDFAGRTYLQASIPVHRKQVEHDVNLHGFQCECYAWSRAGGTAKSDPALVKIAFLKKHFLVTPTAERKPVGTLVNMLCQAPEGDPEPEVFWLKNGEEIVSRQDPNVIVAHDGALLINSARISDSANYTCGVRNVASRRVTETVPLKIYVDGGWAEWGPWVGDCGRMDCEALHQNDFAKNLPKLRRTRTCTNPAPANGGADCAGVWEKRQECVVQCPVHGAWSSWSQWSTCTLGFKQFRTRVCDEPNPQYGGRPCEGPDYDARNGSATDCKNLLGAYDAAYKSGGDTSTAPPVHRAMIDQNSIVGIACAAILGALLLFAVVVACVIWMRRRKGTGNGVYYGPSPHLNPVVHMQQPDLMQNVALLHDDTLKKYPPPTSADLSSFSLKSGRSSRSGGQPGSLNRANGEYRSFKRMNFFFGSKAALLVDSSSGNSSHPPSVGSAERQPRSVSQCSNNSEEHYATLGESGDYDETLVCEQENNRNSVISAALPANLDPHLLAWAPVGCSGRRLVVPDCSISVTLPEGVFDRQQTADVYIAVCSDSADRPKLNDRQTLLSNVVALGPAACPYRKPVIVSLQHCAQLTPQNNWDVEVWSCDDSTSEWQHVVTLGAEDINTPLYCQLEQNVAHLMLESVPNRLALVGKTKADHPPAIKRLQLAAFASLYQSSADYCIRVYCVEDTDATLHGVQLEEDRLRGTMLGKPCSFHFQEGANLCFCIEDVGPGWQIKPGANYQEIPGSHVWRGRQQLHCAFSLEQQDPAASALSCRLLVCQTNSPLLQRQVLYIQASVAKERSHSADSTVSPYHCSPVVQLLHAARPDDATRIPVSVKRKLGQLLNRPQLQNDWRSLAHKLAFDRYLNYFATKTSPTEALLDLWEAVNTKAGAVSALVQIFQDMQRPDAAAVLLEPYVTGGLSV